MSNITIKFSGLELQLWKADFTKFSFTPKDAQAFQIINHALISVKNSFFQMQADIQECPKEYTGDFKT